MCDFIPTSKIYIFHYPCALQAKCLGNFLCFLKINRLTQKIYFDFVYGFK